MSVTEAEAHAQGIQLSQGGRAFQNHSQLSAQVSPLPFYSLRVSPRHAQSRQPSQTLGDNVITRRLSGVGIGEAA